MDDSIEQLPDDILQALQKERARLYNDDDGDLLALTANVYLLWWLWADFELVIINPKFPEIEPPHIIMPETLPEKLSDSSQIEFVYPIHDHGYKLSTSKGTEMYLSGMSMCKLYFTIEKMIFLLIERLKAGGISTETEVQIAFGGHELAQRKAFESVINLSYNVVVTNFDPGSWGERYLQVVKRLSDKGYGYPAAAPRDIYRITRSSSVGTKPIR